MNHENRTIAICGGGSCGICYIEIPDSIDSGATFNCIQCKKPIVFDVWSPENRSEFFRKTYEKNR